MRILAPERQADNHNHRAAGEPCRAGVDPYRKLIDRDRNDAVVALKAAGTK